MSGKLWRAPPGSPVESRLAELRLLLAAPAIEPLDSKARCLAAAAATLATGSDDAAFHGLAARRAGASWAEIDGLAALVERMAGQKAGNTASSFSSAVRRLEHQARVDGAFAANG